jgi:hypothetical protein
MFKIHSVLQLDFARKRVNGCFSPYKCFGGKIIRVAVDICLVLWVEKAWSREPNKVSFCHDISYKS